MAKRRFEFDDGQSAKFWEIELQGNCCLVRYGRLGSAGRTAARQFASPGDAQSAVARLVREKLRKGYRERRVAGLWRPVQGVRRPTVPPGQAQARTSCGARLLGEAIYRESAQHGAKVNRLRELRELPKSVKRCPALIAEFHQRIVWPRSKAYVATIDDRDLEGISFYGPIQEFNPQCYGVAGCEGMDLFGVGSHGGGNGILLLDGNDRRPSDPTLYEVDHDPEPGDELWSFGRLSKFLQRLASPD